MAMAMTQYAIRNTQCPVPRAPQPHTHTQHGRNGTTSGCAAAGFSLGFQEIPATSSK
jgi:hypothetical protein